MRTMLTTLFFPFFIFTAQAQCNYPGVIEAEMNGSIIEVASIESASFTCLPSSQIEENYYMWIRREGISTEWLTLPNEDSEELTIQLNNYPTKLRRCYVTKLITGEVFIAESFPITINQPCTPIVLTETDTIFVQQIDTVLLTQIDTFYHVLIEVDTVIEVVTEIVFETDTLIQTVFLTDTLIQTVFDTITETVTEIVEVECSEPVVVEYGDVIYNLGCGDFLGLAVDTVEIIETVFDTIEIVEIDTVFHVLTDTIFDVVIEECESYVKMPSGELFVLECGEVFEIPECDTSFTFEILNVRCKADLFVNSNEVTASISGVEKATINIYDFYTGSLIHNSIIEPSETIYLDTGVYVIEWIVTYQNEQRRITKTFTII